MDRPNATQAKAKSEVLTALTDPVVNGLLDEAVPLTVLLTARRIGGIEGESFSGCPLEEVPEWMEPLVLRAIVSVAEMVRGSTSRKARRSAGGRELRSFTAGPYSESYFSPQDLASSRRLVPDAAAADALWAVATPCARAYYEALWSGEVAPEGIVTEFAWFPEARGGY